MTAITYNTLAERIIRDLSGGDIPYDSPYNPEFVKQHIRDAMATHLKLEALRRRSGVEDERSALDPFVATFPNIDVVLDKPTARVYAELPAQFLSLKYNGGIKSVSTMTKSHKPMIRCGQPGVSSHLRHSSLEKQNYLYYVEGMKIFWLRDIKQEGIHKVLIKLITVHSSAFGDDDMLPVIPETLGEVIAYCKMQIQNKMPQDRLVDNNPNLRALNEQSK